MPRKSFEVNVEPKVLVWARESIGLYPEDVSEKLRLPLDFIENLETSQKKPTVGILEQLAKIYKRPLAALFLTVPPEEPPMPRDFRYLPSKKEVPLSPKTRLAIRNSWRLQSLAVELTKALGREISFNIQKIKLFDDPEEVAKELRQKLKIEISTQIGWKSKYHAFYEWKKAIERLGILVFQMSMPLNEIRGFSLTKGDLPVIIVNTQDLANARIFSLFHEFAHINLDKSGICNMKEPLSFNAEDKNIEVFCNHFAGSLLIPEEALLNHELIKKISSFEDIDKILKKLSSEFKVSQEVVLRRMLMLNLIGKDIYQQKREEWKEKEWKPKKRGFFVNPIDKCIREKGEPFISLTFEAYKQKKITYSDVADYLSARIKYLPEVQNQIESSI